MISRRYMAGFFDGEGCINITVGGKYKQVSLRVMIVNTDPQILLDIHQSFGGVLADPHLHKPGWKLFRQVVFTGKAAYEFLFSLYPHLRIKKPQAKLAIEFWQFMSLPKMSRCQVFANPNCPRGFAVRRTPETLEKEAWFKRQMHELNRKGLIQ